MCIRDSSTTKYMDGHGAVLGGAIVDGGKFDWMAHAEKFPGLCTPCLLYTSTLLHAQQSGVKVHIIDLQLQTQLVSDGLSLYLIHI